MKGSPDSGLGDGCFALLAPSLFKCLSTTKDRDVLQVRRRPRSLVGHHNISCSQNDVTRLTLVIRKDCSQLLSWSDASCRSGLDNVLSVIAKLLQSQDESGGLAIGDLIIQLLLLQAMIARMTSAKTGDILAGGS
jgi:importin-9